MRVNLICRPHVAHGSSVVWKWVQLGGGGVIFMVATFDVASLVQSSRSPRQLCSGRKGGAFNGDLNAPNRALVRVDGHASAHLFDKPPYQAESMPLAFGFRPKAGAVVADAHGCEIAVGTAHCHAN